MNAFSPELVSLGIVWIVQLLGFAVGFVLPVLEILPEIMIPRRDRFETSLLFRRKSRELFVSFRWYELYALWHRTMEQLGSRIVHRRVIFLGVFIAMTIFVFSSTQSIFARGVICGFSVAVAWAIVPLLQSIGAVRQLFFADLSHEASDQVVRLLAIVWVMLAMITSFLLVFSV